MAEGARMAEELGADIIDINMGCPAREVTGKQSGSALMRDLDHADAPDRGRRRRRRVPVTLKMRIGWDDASRNAPELAQRAEAAGVQLITVHARTRCQFFKGTADWAFVRARQGGRARSRRRQRRHRRSASAQAALAASGADAVMVGRGAYGAPWMPARIAATLTSGRDPGSPPLAEQARDRRWPRRGHARPARRAGTACASPASTSAGIWRAAAARRRRCKAWRRRLCTSEDAARGAGRPAAVLRRGAEEMAA